MKMCNKCKQVKDNTAFSRSIDTKDGLVTRCRDCIRLIDSNNYKNLKENHPEKYLAIHKKTKLRTFLKKKECYEYLIDYCKTHFCLNCGEADFTALEFHHRNYKEKITSISILFNLGLLDEIKQEITKCDVLCSSCHKKVTAIQQGWYLIYQNSEEFISKINSLTFVEGHLEYQDKRDKFMLGNAKKITENENVICPSCKGFKSRRAEICRKCRFPDPVRHRKQRERGLSGGYQN